MRPAILSMLILLVLGSPYSWGDEEASEILHRARQMMMKGEMETAEELCMQVLLTSGEGELYAQAWELVRLLDVYDSKYQEQYADFARAGELLAYGYLDEARITLRGISNTPKELGIAIWERLAEIGLRLGDLEQSIEYYERIFKEYPQSDQAPWALYHLSEIYEQMGDSDEMEEVRELLLVGYGDSVPAHIIAERGED